MNLHTTQFISFSSPKMILSSAPSKHIQFMTQASGKKIVRINEDRFKFVEDRHCIKVIDLRTEDFDTRVMVFSSRNNSLQLQGLFFEDRVNTTILPTTLYEGSPSQGGLQHKSKLDVEEIVLRYTDAFSLVFQKSVNLSTMTHTYSAKIVLCVESSFREQPYLVPHPGLVAASQRSNIRSDTEDAFENIYLGQQNTFNLFGKATVSHAQLAHAASRHHLAHSVAVPNARVVLRTVLQGNRVCMAIKGQTAPSLASALDQLEYERVEEDAEVLLQAVSEGTKTYECKERPVIAVS